MTRVDILSMLLHQMRSNKCDSCGQSIVSRQSSNRTSSDSNSIGYKDSSSFEVGLQNGFDENNILTNHSGTKTSQGTTECTSDDVGSLNTSRSSKVTFDLQPDFEHEQREFCRRRTRSIVIDAVSIYSKYISLEASHPIGLEESIRRQIESKLNTHSKTGLSLGAGSWWISADCQTTLCQLLLW